MQVIDGRAIAQKIRKELKQKIQASGITPGLAVILVGNDPASHLYVSLKEKACVEVGIHFEKYLFFATEPEEKIVSKIIALNQRPDIHGIIVQLPLPSQFDTNKIIQAIDPRKDADGFHPKNTKMFFAGQGRVTPVTTKAIITLIESTGISLTNKSTIILANSHIFADPIKKMLDDRGAKTEILIYNPITPLNYYTNIPLANILITALGQPQIINAQHIKDDAIVIDVGTTRVNLGTDEQPIWKTIGDVDQEGLKEKPGFITPVPGGVGPVTVATLLENIFALATQ